MLHARDHEERAASTPDNTALHAGGYAGRGVETVSPERSAARLLARGTAVGAASCKDLAPESTELRYIISLGVAGRIPT